LGADRSSDGPHRNTKSPKRLFSFGCEGWIVMGWVEAHRGRVSSTIALTLTSAVIASGAAIYVLYAIHAPRPADTGPSIEGAISGDNMSAEERRELTRQMLKARRENPETPEIVRPTPSTRTATNGTAERGASMDSIRPRPAGTSASTPLARPSPSRRPEATASSYPIPPQAGGANSQLPPTAAPDLVTGTVPPAAPPVATAVAGVTPPGLVTGASGSVAATAANGGPSTEPAQRGFAGSVFSSLSGIAGTAANVTGNTVNWVIDLPGRAISAGGRLLRSSDASANPPSGLQPPPQSGAPAPPVQDPVQSGPPTPRRNNL